MMGVFVGCDLFDDIVVVLDWFVVYDVGIGGFDDEGYFFVLWVVFEFVLGGFLVDEVVFVKFDELVEICFIGFVDWLEFLELGFEIFFKL